MVLLVIFYKLFFEKVIPALYDSGIKFVMLVINELKPIGLKCELPTGQP
jgi:hypothetical protein